MNKQKWLLKGFLFVLITIVLVLLSNTYHRNTGTFNWKSEIWADKAGYYIYLPVTFLYRYDLSKAPEKIDEKTGYGFTIDNTGKKIQTKYTCGVSVMIFPFFAATHYYCKLKKVDELGGFAQPYNKMINLAAIFYFLLGLFFLKRLLAFYYPPWIQYTTLLVLFLTTNLFYYVLADTLMSHVYSFSLFAFFLYSLKRFLDNDKDVPWFIAVAFSTGLIFLVRPVNVLFFILFFFWDVSGFQDVWARIRLLFRPGNLLIFVLITGLMIFPQLVYWNYTYGSWFHYSYGNEGFTNWSNPYIAEVLFAPLNGLFLYSPLMILVFAGMAWMILKRQKNGILVLLFFLALVYECAAWHCWYFGCSFGQRAFVEYLVLFSIPVSFILQTFAASRFRAYLLSFIILVLVVFSFYTISLSMNYEKCFFGSTWDWPHFGRQLYSSGIKLVSQPSSDFYNDFENGSLREYQPQTSTIVHSGLFSIAVVPEKEFCCQFIKPVRDFPGTMTRFVKAGIWIYKEIPDSLGAILVCTLDMPDGKSVSWHGCNIDAYVLGPGKWYHVEKEFLLPADITGDMKFGVYLWNRKKSTFFADDMSVKFVRK